MRLFRETAEASSLGASTKCWSADVIPRPGCVTVMINISSDVEQLSDIGSNGTSSVPVSPTLRLERRTSFQRGLSASSIETTEVKFLITHFRVDLVWEATETWNCVRFHWTLKRCEWMNDQERWVYNRVSWFDSRQFNTGDCVTTRQDWFPADHRQTTRTLEHCRHKYLEG